MSKRPHDSSSGPANPPKRSKASQACAQCRKHKTRCELLDGLSAAGSLTCHRCKVLNVPCSFEASNIIHLPPSQSKPLTSRAILVNNPIASSSSSASSPESLQVASPAAAASLSTPTPPLHPGNQLPSPTPSSSSDQGYQHNHTNNRGNIGANTITNANASTSTSTNTRSVKHVRELLCPEDLVPDCNVPWGPSVAQGDFDWTTVPILAIQELASKNNPYPSFVPSRIGGGLSEADRDLDSVLSKDQISRLLEIFELRYAPWLCLSPRRLDQASGSSPLLDLIRCTVAARHLDAVTRASVSPRLQKLTERLFLNHLMGGFDPKPESIEALLILSLWSPLTNAGYSTKRDARALASSAVGFAMDLGLSEASVVRMQAVMRMGGADGDPEVSLDELNAKTRLWLLVSTTESITCVGTGRAPVSRTTEADLKFIDPTCIKDIESARNNRLGFVSRMLEVLEQGCKIRLRSPSNFEPFYIETQQVIRSIACMESFIKPLPMVSQYEQFFFDMILLQFHGWSLVLSHYFLRELRTVMDGHNGQSWTCARFKGIPIVLIYGNDAINSAQNVLSIFLSQTDTALLAAAPDHVFNLITFAATWIIISNFSMHQLSGVNLGWANDKLIALVAEKLSHIAHSPEHLPAQCAHMIMRLIHAWETRHMASKGGKEKSCSSSNPVQMPHGEKWEVFSVKRHGSEHGNEHGHGHEHGHEYSGRVMPQMSAERTTADETRQDTGIFECPFPQSSSSSSSPSASSMSSSSPSSQLRQDESQQQQKRSQTQTPSGDPNSWLLSGMAQEWTDVPDMLMVDASFWATFMENLNSETPAGAPA